MPKKTKRGKAFRSKKKRAGRAAVPVSAAAPATDKADAAPATTPGVRAARTKAPAVKYPYVLAELRRIGILAGAILVILVILALVL